MVCDTENSPRFREAMENLSNRCATAYAERQVLPESLTELRTCLFFEQRRWHHFGEDPNGQSGTYIHALLEGIRRKVQSREVE